MPRIRSSSHHRTVPLREKRRGSTAPVTSLMTCENVHPGGPELVIIGSNRMKHPMGADPQSPSSDAHQISVTARRLLGAIRILQVAAALYLLRAGVSLVVIPIARLREVLYNLDLEDVSDLLFVISAGASHLIRLLAVGAATLVLIALWRTAAVKDKRISEPLYWMAGGHFVLIVLAQMAIIADGAAETLTGLPMINTGSLIPPAEAWVFPPFAVVSAIGCAMIAARFNQALEGRLMSAKRVRALAGSAILLISVAVGLLLITRWLFPPRLGPPLDSTMFEALSGLRLSGGACAWFVWQSWLLIEMIIVGHSLRRFVSGGFCPKCGYYVGDRIAENCPECGWGRGPARGAV
ncbi:MAG: hypothetical protein SYC29_00200 [Planctomycetota bacterium]|nr:hypothetical protein [Planctomycetota bacterium]